MTCGHIQGCGESIQDMTSQSNEDVYNLKHQPSVDTVPKPDNASTACLGVPCLDIDGGG